MNKTKIFLLIVVLAVLIQFIPYGKDHVNPQVVSSPKWDSPKTKQLFDNTCADCHSFETKWPWYSKIAPVSWLVYSDVQEGREHFNVSAWGVQKKNKGDEAAKAVEEGDMPMFIYPWMHPKARLSDQDKKDLISGLKATFGEK
ncbi:MAG: heme-binding domain-containing protein [Sulfurospirillaceae bacterium]|nr:heme-binding domain-containing protein [Sulfurospirillaceae bacterium]